MDVYVDSNYLSTAFAILRNYVRSRRRSVQFLEELVRNKTGRSPDCFPDIKFLLTAASEDIAKIENSINETLAKGLDHDVNVKLESAKEQILRLSRTDDRPAAGEVLVSCLNEESERVRIRRPSSPKKVTFSPEVRSTPLLSRPSAARCTGVSSNGVARIPIPVTATTPKIGDLDCLICQQKFMKRQSLMEHVTNLHKVSSRLHDVLFQTLTSQSDADLCCIICNKTFATRKLAFRHSRDDHTENYNTFIKIMAMTGSLKSYHSFFMNLDKDSADEPVANNLPASGPGSQHKGRRRSRLTAVESADLSHLPKNATPVPNAGDRSATSTSQVPDPGSRPSAPPLDESGSKALALRPALKRKETTSLSQSSGGVDHASQQSAVSVDATVKRGRGRPSLKKSPPQPSVLIDDTEPHCLTVKDVSVSFPIHNLRNREPVQWTSASAGTLSAPMESELDSSSPAGLPLAAECAKCGMAFINAFELGLHELKSCKYRKPATLSGRKTRFAMKSTKPSLDEAQEKKLKEFYTKSRLQSKSPSAASGGAESPLKSGVQLDMRQRKRKLDLDDDVDGNGEIECEAKFTNLTVEEQRALVVKCTEMDVKVLLTPIAGEDMQMLFQSPRCLIDLEQ